MDQLVVSPETILAARIVRDDDSVPKVLPHEPGIILGRIILDRAEADRLRQIEHAGPLDQLENRADTAGPVAVTLRPALIVEPVNRQPAHAEWRSRHPHLDQFGRLEDDA